MNYNDKKNKSIPKVVVSNDDYLIYMSRSPIPGNKLNEFKYSHRQICIYSFPRNLLLKFSRNKKTFNLLLKPNEHFAIAFDSRIELNIEINNVKIPPSKEHISKWYEVDIPKNHYFSLGKQDFCSQTNCV